MGSIAERVIGGALDLFYRLKHPNAIVSRRVAEYLEEEFGPPQKKGRGILFWHRRPA